MPVCRWCSTEYDDAPEGMVLAIEATRDLEPPARALVMAMPAGWRTMKPIPWGDATRLHACSRGRVVAVEDV